MGVPGKTLRSSVTWALVALTTLAAAACGDDGAPGGDDAWYVQSPVDASWGVGAAGVDRDGTLVLTGQDRGLTVPPGDRSGVVTGKTFEAPAELSSDDPRGVSVDGSRTAWVLVGDTLLPVRATDGELHAASATLEKVGARDAGAVLPGAVPDQARATTAVAVVDDTAAVVGSYADVGSADARGNVLVHRVGAGEPVLLAGRAWTGSSDRPKPATTIEPGESAPATDVDLDDVVALQPLADDRLLIITSIPTETSSGRLSFFVLDGADLTRVEVAETYAGIGKPGVTTSLTAQGRVIANVSTGTGAKPEPATLSIDPKAGTGSVVEHGTATASGYGTLHVADADGGGLLAVTPPGGDPEDDDNDVNVRITSAPLPGD
jgi:hypothetical protein